MTDRHRGSVLVVEDDAATREAYRALLEREGWDVEEAADGGEALRLAHHAPPSLAVVDISVPGIDGWETARRLKRGAGERGVPVIVVTGHALDSDRETAREVGCEGYMVKPIDPQRFLEEVERLIAAGDG